MFKKVILSSITLMIIFILSPFFFPLVFSQGGTFLASMSGNEYQIITDSLNSGGGELSESANFILSDTIGEIGSGESSSANYRILAGYRQMQESYLAISSEADLNLASIGGVTGGESSGTVGWTVTTDNPAGYQMSVKSDSEPSMQSTGNLYSFQDYYPRGSNYGALDFDGANDYVKVDNTIATSSNELTVISRFKKLSGGANYEVTLHKSTNSSIGDSDYWIGVDSNDNLSATIGSNTGVGWAAGQTTTVANYDQWYDVAAVWDGSVVKVYIDGVFNKQYNLSSFSGLNQPTRFGASSDGGHYQFRGLIGENRIYERALSGDEIEAFSDGGFISDDSLVGKWTFDAGSGATVNDDSLANNDGINYGATWDNYTLNPTYNFNILNTQSAFGISPEGTHIVDRFKDNGSACATGSLDTAAKCWIGLSTDDVTVSQSFSSTQPDGAQTTLRFRAASGASNIQPAANYSATITVTAIPQ